MRNLNYTFRINGNAQFSNNLVLCMHFHGHKICTCSIKNIIQLVFFCIRKWIYPLQRSTINHPQKSIPPLIQYDIEINLMVSLHELSVCGVHWHRMCCIRFFPRKWYWGKLIFFIYGDFICVLCLYGFVKNDFQNWKVISGPNTISNGIKKETWKKKLVKQKKRVKFVIYNRWIGMNSLGELKYAERDDINEKKKPTIQYTISQHTEKMMMIIVVRVCCYT